MGKGLYLIVGLGVLIVVLGGFFLFWGGDSRDTAPNTTQNSPTPTPQVQSVTIQLSSQNNSGETGTATLTNENGKTKVVLSLNGAPANVTQPAHIHSQPCANIGAVKYPLTSALNGASQTILDIPLSQILSELPLAVNVHKSNAESSVYAACGDIQNTQSGSSILSALTHTVTYSDSGYSPSELRIKAGDTVMFKNESSIEMWTASAMHPSHKMYPNTDIVKCSSAVPGTMFDMCKGMSKGSEWSFKFTEKGAWGYHNHMNASHFGKIIIE
ncbi:MAG: hypothetical protein HYV77_02000 [Candidatus Wildermuthbacteria bacterium]|nr:hypothetical protein [Candidatus Wildermuthbacteria bacterium]